MSRSIFPKGELCCRDKEELSLFRGQGEELQCGFVYWKLKSYCGRKDGPEDTALGIDADESMVLFLVRVGAICVAFCKSEYHMLSIPIAKIKISWNSIFLSKGKVRKLSKHGCEQLANGEECWNKQLYV